MDDFFKIRECLDFLKQLPITTQKGKKLNRERASVASKANAIKCWFAKGHSAEVDVSW